MPIEEKISFAIMNGQCHLTSDAIDFEYSPGSVWLKWLFGKHAWRRTVVLALVVGLPLTAYGIVCFANGFWGMATFPLLFGMWLLLAPILTLSNEEFSFPDSISRNSIQSILAKPPTRWILGDIIIAYQSEGAACKTLFALAAGSYAERVVNFESIVGAFAEAGLKVDLVKLDEAS